MLLDPHSAVGVSAARRAVDDGTLAPSVPVVALACAHPAKFQDAVTRATGNEPALPPHLADLMSRSESMQHAPATAAAVRELILTKRRAA
jgi:threonine synthase